MYGIFNKRTNELERYPIPMTFINYEEAYDLLYNTRAFQPKSDYEIREVE